MDYSPPGSCAHGVSQARILELFAISFSRGSSQPREQTHVSRIASGFFTSEPPGKPPVKQYSVLKRNGLSRHKKTWRTLKCLLLCDRSPCNSNYITFQKRQTSDSKNTIRCQGLKIEKNEQPRNIQSIEDFQGDRTLCDSLIVDKYPYILIKTYRNMKHQE